MTPLERLHEELENVERALRETLRYDYGPERTREYYDECAARIAEIKKATSGVAPTDRDTISAQLNELSFLATWISLIERSHLGEFSWPFADELRRMAKALFAEKTLKGDRLEPIIHVVAEGHGYRIVYETQVPAASGKRRFVVVAFPRSLKHHVLLHTIFGHELGHTALHTAVAGNVLQADVMAALSGSGPMENEASATAWMNDVNAPQEIKDALARYEARFGQPYVFADSHLQNWLIELICDLFGILLFGPGFLAAHRVILEPMHPNVYGVDLTEPTHPPYAVRHRMLVQIMRLLGWDRTVTNASHDVFHQAETELLKFLLEDPYDPWVTVFDDAQLKIAISGVQSIFATHVDLGYTPMNAKTLVALIDGLAKGYPPVLAEIDPEGKPLLTKIDISQSLYAGWIYWEGRGHLKQSIQPSFHLTNRLCNHALLQQCAINMAINEKVA